jgi:hypothetical protein
MSTIITGRLILSSVPDNDDALTQILAIDPDGEIKYVDSAALGGGGGGTVTSFSAGDLTPLFTTSEATPTSTPALSFTLVNQNANIIYSGPTNGAAAAPTFRALVTADIADDMITLPKLADQAALSVVANATNASASPTAITAGTDHYVLKRTGVTLAFGQITSGSITDNNVTDAKLRQSAALSVVGNSTNSTANVADIAAGSDHQVLRRNGTAIAFGAVNLAQSAAVTGILALASGGTGQSTIAARSIWIANSADTITSVTPGAGQSIRINAGNTAWEAYTPSGGGIGGTTGSVDNAILRADGTGGSTVQSSSLTIDDSGNIVKASSLSITTSDSIDFFFGSGGNSSFTFEDNRLDIDGSGGDLAWSKVTTSATTVHAISAAAGIAGAVTGNDLIISSGAAYTVGNNNSGNVYIDLGAKNGTGVVGNIGLFTTSGSFGAGQKTLFVGNATAVPSSNPSGGALLFASGNRLYGRTSVGYAMGGVIFTDTTQIGNVGTGEDVLFTTSIPANTLNSNKDTLSFTMTGTITNTANTKRIRVKFGGTTFFDTASVIPISATITFVIRGTIIRTGATTQKCEATMNTSNSTRQAYASYTIGTETLSGAINLQVTGEATADNDIVGEMFKVWWEPAEG